MRDIDSLTKPIFFDRRISDVANHSNSKFSKLCTQLIMSSARGENMSEMIKLYTEIVEMKKSFDEGFGSIKKAITYKHQRPVSFYGLRCFKNRSNKLWTLMTCDKDLLMNKPKTQEDIVEEFISMLNGEYIEFAINKKTNGANIGLALRELADELADLYNSTVITSHIG